MPVQKFEQLILWQKAQKLTLRIYSEINFGNDFNFKNQITRAAISVSNNIAEGHDRESPKEFKNFLRYSKGSCAEVRSMIYLAKALKYVDEVLKNSLLEDCFELNRMIFGLQKSIKIDFNQK
jgi:four helix bundle protein